MASKKFKDYTLTYKIIEAFDNTDNSWGNYSGFFESFVSDLDIGIIVTNKKNLNTFKIIDEKKWLLTKIKYGF